MSDIISRLQHEHRHLTGIFDLIESELDEIEKSSEQRRSLLVHILEYIKYYPDVFHHPLEDLLFDRLEGHGALSKVVADLKSEHLELARKTKDFRDALTEFDATGSTDSRQKLISLGRNFVASQRDHMRKEEELIFPGAADCLTVTDWDVICDYAALASPTADPVFGPSVKARYRELREKIEDHLRPAK